MLKKFFCTVSRISSRLASFGLETKGARPSRVSSRLVTRHLDLVSPRDSRLVTGPSTNPISLSVNFRLLKRRVKRFCAKEGYKF